TGFFAKLSQFDEIMAEILGPRCLEYVVLPPWYVRVVRAITRGLKWSLAGILSIPYMFGRARGGIYVALGLAALIVALLATLLVVRQDNAYTVRILSASPERMTEAGGHGPS